MAAGGRGGGGGGVVVEYTGKKTQTGRKVLTGKLKELTFFETCFKQSNGRNTLTGHHLPKRLGNLYPIMIILLAR